ncbi:hypothetical protein RSOL_110880, partial [Rhizoctonia solani AG-3 Rhs1AP]
MSPKNPPREKCATKEVPESQQYLDDIAKSKKRQEQSQYKKALKAQGAGSTIPATRKSAVISQDTTVEDSPDEEFDPILAEAQAYEATLNTLQAKIATRYAICFKDLRTLDEEELQAMWDNGPSPKVKETGTSGSQCQNSQVQSVGPAQRILSTPAVSAMEGTAKKRKCSSTPAGSKSKAGKADNTKDNGNKRSSNAKKGMKSHAAKVVSDGDDSADGSSGGSGPKEDEDDNDNEGEGSDNEGGGGTKVKGKRGKTSNFSGVVKKMVDFTTIRVCAKLAATRMFCSAREYTSLVYRCWKHSAAEYGVDAHNAKYKLQKRHMQAVNPWTVKGLTPDKAKARIQQWFPHVYHTKVGAPRGVGHFQHDFIPDAVFESYFTGLNPVGIVYKKWFDPMPLPAIALVCAIIVWVINRHKSRRYVAIKMTFEKLHEYYTGIMDSLNAFKSGKQAKRCLERAGVAVDEEESQPAEDTLGDNDFAEDTPTAEELELISRKLAKRSKATNHADKSPHIRKSSHGAQSDRSGSVTPGHNSPSLPRQSISPPPATSPAAQPTPRLSVTASTKDGSAGRVRLSSVSLNHEESEPEEYQPPTPTPLHRLRPTNTQTESPTRDETQDDNETDTEETQKESNMDTEDEADEPQPLKKKVKTTPANKFVEKLVAGSEKKKRPSPKEARELQKLLLSKSSSSQKAKATTKLKII